MIFGITCMVFGGVVAISVIAAAKLQHHEACRPDDND